MTQDFEPIVEPVSNPIYHEKSSTSTYSVISTVAFLIGVPEHIFENVHESPDIEIYQKLKFNRNACIIRDLCMVRTAIIRPNQQLQKFVSALVGMEIHQRHIHYAGRFNRARYQAGI